MRCGNSFETFSDVLIVVGMMAKGPDVTHFEAFDWLPAVDRAHAKMPFSKLLSDIRVKSCQQASAQASRLALKNLKPLGDVSLYCKMLARRGGMKIDRGWLADPYRSVSTKEERSSNEAASKAATAHGPSGMPVRGWQRMVIGVAPAWVCCGCQVTNRLYEVFQQGLESIALLHCPYQLLVRACQGVCHAGQTA